MVANMLVGYARVSTWDQTANLQLDALMKAGCGEIFAETASGKNAERPELKAALASLSAGDTLVVWKLDRLGRSVTDILQIIEGLRARGVAFKSLSDGIGVGDESNPMGRAMLQLMAVFAELERSLIIERTQAGLIAARARGRVGGRRPKLNEADLARVRQMIDDCAPVTEIAKELGVSRVTAYKYLGQLEVKTV